MDVRNAIVTTEPQLPSAASPELQDLLRRVLLKDPFERITLQVLGRGAGTDALPALRPPCRVSGFFRGPVVCVYSAC